MDSSPEWIARPTLALVAPSAPRSTKLISPSDDFADDVERAVVLAAVDGHRLAILDELEFLDARSDRRLPGKTVLRTDRRLPELLACRARPLRWPSIGLARRGSRRCVPRRRADRARNESVETATGSRSPAKSMITGYRQPPTRIGAAGVGDHPESRQRRILALVGTRPRRYRSRHSR